MFQEFGIHFFWNLRTFTLKNYNFPKIINSHLYHKSTKILTLSHSIKCYLNPILGGGGHYGLDDRERPRCFRRVRTTTTKIHDFVSVYVWMVPWKSFFGFVFKFFEKRKKFFLTISTSKGPPFGKKIENFKKIFFLEKIILFLFEFVLYMF